MKTAMWIGLVIIGLALTPAVRAAEKRERKATHVTMDQLPAAVKSTIEKESAGAKVEEIEKETERGKTFYEAEIVKDGRTSYVHVSADGKVLKRETAEQERKAEPGERGEGHR